MNSSLTISLVQTSLHWEDKPSNLGMLTEKIVSIQEKTELVVLPEMFSTGFSMRAEQLAETMEGPTVQWMRSIAVERKIILAGSIIIKEDEKFFNRFIWMLPNGQCGYYDKRHLFAFAGEDQFFKAGTKRLITSVKGWKINVQVCYDLRFPVWARQSSFSQSENGTEPEYDLLINVANWPEKRNQAWKTLLQARAIENQCFVVGVNRVGVDGKGNQYSGDSMVVDPLGTILCTGNEEQIFTITLDKEKLITTRAQLPFLKDGDSFHILEE